jgi:hypothetical protein
MLVLEAADQRYSHEGGEDKSGTKFLIIIPRCEKLFPPSD